MANRPSRESRPKREADSATPRLVLDTNVFVAAGFNPRNNSAHILERVSEGSWIMVWNRDTRRETVAVLARIPPLSRWDVDSAFYPEAEVKADTHPEHFGLIEDPDDRKFAALAAAAGAILVTSDGHLLSQRDRMEVEVLTPGEVVARFRER
jgi:uncharacterized protein